jgi:hypothetical protein
LLIASVIVVQMTESAVQMTESAVANDRCVYGCLFKHLCPHTVPEKWYSANDPNMASVENMFYKILNPECKDSKTQAGSQTSATDSKTAVTNAETAKPKNCAFNVRAHGTIVKVFWKVLKRWRDAVVLTALDVRNAKSASELEYSFPNGMTARCANPTLILHVRFLDFDPLKEAKGSEVEEIWLTKKSTFERIRLVVDDKTNVGALVSSTNEHIENVSGQLVTVPTNPGDRHVNMSVGTLTAKTVCIGDPFG